MEYKISESQRRYQKRYYEKNREQILARQKRWREENAEHLKAYRRKYAMTHDRREYYKAYREKQKKLKEEVSDVGGGVCVDHE